MNMPPYTITEQVYRQIKELILNGRYIAGERLLEVQISLELKVSRSPVREALRRLVSDGFLVYAPNKGVFVREYQEKDLHDIFELRSFLEKLGIERSTDKITPEIKEKLLNIKTGIADCIKIHDIAAYTRLDTELHNRIVRFSDNDVFITMYNHYNYLITPIRTFALNSPERTAKSVDEHFEIIDNIISGDIERAIATSELHLRQTFYTAKNFVNARKRTTGGEAQHP
jgi:DNA-binding GntR family transcriptional regulator